MATAARPPTQRDVADRAEVSTATVSYVLTGRDRPVKDETVRRVLDAARQLGYQRNHSARSLRRQRTELVCVVYRPPGNPWVELLTEQLHASAVRRGYGVIGLPIAPDDRADTALRVLREHYVDGAILTPGYCITATEVRRLARGGLGLVVFDDRIAPQRFDAVRLHQAAACQDVVRHLVGGGRRRIAYIAHEDELRGSGPAVVYRAYRQALVDLRLPWDESLVIPGADSRADAYTGTTRLLESAEPPDAIFSGSDRGAIDAIWAARDLGWSVPGDVSIAGAGNIPEGEVVRPALTTAGFPGTDFSSVVERLWTRIEDPTHRGTELDQPWELIVRTST